MPPPPDPLLGEQAACSSLRPSGFFNRKKDAFISRWDSFDISDRTHLNYVNKVEALKVYWASASVCGCFRCVCVCVCVCLCVGVLGGGALLLPAMGLCCKVTIPQKTSRYFFCSQNLGFESTRISYQQKGMLTLD